jgi:hypothetical protein
VRTWQYIGKLEKIFSRDMFKNALQLS